MYNFQKKGPGGPHDAQGHEATGDDSAEPLRMPEQEPAYQQEGGEEEQEHLVHSEDPTAPAPAPVYIKTKPADRPAARGGAPRAAAPPSGEGADPVMPGDDAAPSEVFTYYRELVKLHPIVPPKLWREIRFDLPSTVAELRLDPPTTEQIQGREPTTPSPCLVIALDGMLPEGSTVAQYSGEMVAYIFELLQYKNASSTITALKFVKRGTDLSQMVLTLGRDVAQATQLLKELRAAGLRAFYGQPIPMHPPNATFQVVDYRRVMHEGKGISAADVEMLLAPFKQSAEGDIKVIEGYEPGVFYAPVKRPESVYSFLWNQFCSHVFQQDLFRRYGVLVTMAQCPHVFLEKGVPYHIQKKRREEEERLRAEGIDPATRAPIDDEDDDEEEYGKDGATGGAKGADTDALRLPATLAEEAQEEIDIFSGSTVTVPVVPTSTRMDPVVAKKATVTTSIAFVDDAEMGQMDAMMEQYHVAGSAAKKSAAAAGAKKDATVKVPTGSEKVQMQRDRRQGRLGEGTDALGPSSAGTPMQLATPSSSSFLSPPAGSMYDGGLYQQHGYGGSGAAPPSSSLSYAPPSSSSTTAGGAKLPALVDEVDDEEEEHSHANQRGGGGHRNNAGDGIFFQSSSYQGMGGSGAWPAPAGNDYGRPAPAPAEDGALNWSMSERRPARPAPASSGVLYGQPASSGLLNDNNNSQYGSYGGPMKMNQPTQGGGEGAQSWQGDYGMPYQQQQEAFYKNEENAPYPGQDGPMYPSYANEYGVVPNNGYGMPFQYSNNYHHQNSVMDGSYAMPYGGQEGGGVLSAPSFPSAAMSAAMNLLAEYQQLTEDVEERVEAAFPQQFAAQKAAPMPLEREELVKLTSSSRGAASVFAQLPTEATVPKPITEIQELLDFVKFRAAAMARLLHHSNDSTKDDAQEVADVEGQIAELRSRLARALLVCAKASKGSLPSWGSEAWTLLSRASAQEEGGNELYLPSLLPYLLDTPYGRDLVALLALSFPRAVGEVLVPYLPVYLCDSAVVRGVVRIVIQCDAAEGAQDQEGGADAATSISPLLAHVVLDWPGLVQWWLAHLSWRSAQPRAASSMKQLVSFAGNTMDQLLGAMSPAERAAGRTRSASADAVNELMKGSYGSEKQPIKSLLWDTTSGALLRTVLRLYINADCLDGARLACALFQAGSDAVATTLTRTHMIFLFSTIAKSQVAPVLSDETAAFVGSFLRIMEERSSSSSSSAAASAVAAETPLTKDDADQLLDNALLVVSTSSAYKVMRDAYLNASLPLTRFDAILARLSVQEPPTTVEAATFAEWYTAHTPAFVPPKWLTDKLALHRSARQKPQPQQQPQKNATAAAGPVILPEDDASGTAAPAKVETVSARWQTQWTVAMLQYPAAGEPFTPLPTGWTAQLSRSYGRYYFKPTAAASGSGGTAPTYKHPQDAVDFLASPQALLAEPGCTVTLDHVLAKAQNLREEDALVLPPGTAGPLLTKEMIQNWNANQRMRNLYFDVATMELLKVQYRRGAVNTNNNNNNNNSNASGHASHHAHAGGSGPQRIRRMPPEEVAALLKDEITEPGYPAQGWPFSPPGKGWRVHVNASKGQYSFRAPAADAEPTYLHPQTRRRYYIAPQVFVEQRRINPIVIAKESGSSKEEVEEWLKDQRTREPAMDAAVVRIVPVQYNTSERNEAEKEEEEAKLDKYSRHAGGAAPPRREQAPRRRERSNSYSGHSSAYSSSGSDDESDGSVDSRRGRGRRGPRRSGGGGGGRNRGGRKRARNEGGGRRRGGRR